VKGICIGMGGRGKSWYRWAQAAGLEVMGVVDIDPTILQRAGDELAISPAQRFGSIAAAVDGTGVTTAVACTANGTHIQVIRECLAAGVNLLIEKPLVETPADLRTVLDTARQKGLQVAAVQNYRYAPQVLLLRQLMQQRAIGEPVMLDVTFARWRPSHGLKLPLMLNQAIHHMDGMRWILGADPEWCFARSWNPTWNDCDGPTVLSAIWGFTGGIVVHYSGSYVTQGVQTPFSGLWKLEGSTGRLEFQGDEDTAPIFLSRREPEENRRIDSPPDPLGVEVHACKEFLAALEAGRMPPTHAVDNARSLAMCWAAQRSSEERRVVQIDEVI
jgi:predicted dehydrogenase